MSPAAEHARLREEAIQLIRQHAPQRLQEPLIELLRPAIALSATRADDPQIPLSASKFGGAPDVPAGFEWPQWNEKPLGFLAQINLEEVAPFDLENKLPKSGLLSFFFDFEEQPWGGFDELGGWRVFHFEGSVLKRMERPRLPVDYKPLYRPIGCARFGAGLEITHYDDFWQLTRVHAPELFYGDPEYGQLDVFCSHVGQRSPCHRLLGNATTVQGDPIHNAVGCSKSWVYTGDNNEELQDAVRSEAENWQLLLQIDSDEELGTCWGDVGIIYFLIRKQDLAERKFENAWFILQCT